MMPAKGGIGVGERGKQCMARYWRNG